MAGLWGCNEQGARDITIDPGRTIDKWRMRPDPFRMKPKNKKPIPVSDWRWYGLAGHLCVANECRFHLHTEVGDRDRLRARSRHTLQPRLSGVCAIAALNLWLE